VKERAGGADEPIADERDEEDGVVAFSDAIEGATGGKGNE